MFVLVAARYESHLQAVDRGFMRVKLPLDCQECERRWVDSAERWRVYLTPEEPPEAVAYCPECAAREFDD